MQTNSTLPAVDASRSSTDLAERTETGRRSLVTTQDKILIESRVTNDGPSIVVGYLLWFFLGLFSAHRFYLKRPGTAVLQILLYFVFVGFIWLLIDAFLIPGMVRDLQQKIRDRLTMEILSAS